MNLFPYPACCPHSERSLQFFHSPDRFFVQICWASAGNPALKYSGSGYKFYIKSLFYFHTGYLDICSAGLFPVLKRFSILHQPVCQRYRLHKPDQTMPSCQIFHPSCRADIRYTAVSIHRSQSGYLQLSLQVFRFFSIRYMMEHMAKGRYVRELARDYVVLDLETTGLSRYEHEIIEIAMVKVRNGIIVDQFQTLIRPACTHIPAFITGLTGISTEMVAEAPPIEETIQSVLDFIGEDLIVGHNTSFDIGFLNMQQELCNRYTDTVQFCRKLYPDLKRHTLSHMTQYLHLSSNSHRAMADVLATYELYERIQQDLKNQNLELSDLFASARPKKSRSARQTVVRRKQDV